MEVMGLMLGEFVDDYTVRVIDVFAMPGPPPAHPLYSLGNVILTPHIGGSTEEAQANIGLDVTAKLVKYLELGTSEGSHTVPPE